MANGICQLCKGKVKSGGDRHAEGTCSKRGVNGDRRRRIRARKRSGRSARRQPARGMAVPGAGKRKVQQG